MLIFRQIIDEDLGCASYLIGDERAGTAAVVDPRLEIDEYLRLARYIGVSIDHVLETHNHADHVSGHGRLVASTGAVVHIHRDAHAEYEHEAFEDGWEQELGSLIVRALHTPGHRPEHTAFVLIDKSRGPEPWALLSGDSLFVGDIARPDLAVEETEGTRGIFRSLHGELLALPGDCELWPGHLGGSMCGGPGMSMKVSSTIGYEHQHNAVLSITDEREFIDRALADLGPQPPNFQKIVAANRGPLLTSTIEVPALSPRQIQRASEDGALVIDIRTDQQFDDAHVRGALSIPALGAGFGSKLAWLAGDEQPVVLIGCDDADAQRAGKLALAVGVSSIAGLLAGGMTSWRQEHHPTVSTQRLAVADLPDRLADGEATQVLDVRERGEWDRGHIPGSLHLPWHDITAIPDGLHSARPVAVICGSGQRAGIAASLLAHHGAEHAIHIVDGGVPKWGALGHPLQGPHSSLA